LFYPYRYSGAAYAIQYPGDDPDRAKISIVRKWKGRLPGDVASSKVPSVIAYKPGGGLIWGFEAVNSETPKPLRWLKLLLEPELDLKPSEVVDIKNALALLKSCGKTPVQVASDYLKALWSHVVEQISEDYSPTTFEFAKKSIILTVPALWSPAAKRNTFLVAAGAGLVCDEFDLQIVSEPEAAAAAILKDRIKEVKVWFLTIRNVLFLLLHKIGDCYIVADAGGGTVVWCVQQTLNFSTNKDRTYQVMRSKLRNHYASRSV
jgi:molecular chaperone DnaK (HSP70)